MKFVVFIIFAAGMALQAASQENVSEVCHGGRVEREESHEKLEKMWPVSEKMDCRRESIDAATTFPDGYTFFFKGDYYWRMYDQEVDPGYPRHISQDWNGLPGNLDAALTWKDKRTFFFKGHEYWSFHGYKMDRGYPRNISEGFCGIPNNLDAALLWKNNSLAYFFKGDQYWRFDGGESCAPVTKEYPLSIKEWRNIPANVDAALQWRNGRTYFIKGGVYYRYHDHWNDSGAGRPIEMHKNWGLKCSELNCRIPAKSENVVLDARKRY